jgi:hypothetical protein
MNAFRSSSVPVTRISEDIPMVKCGTPRLLTVLTAIVAGSMLVLAVPKAAATPTVGFLEDFAPPDGTAGFIGGGLLSNPGTGGRGGVGDGYLRMARDTFPGHLGCFNAGPAFAGDYIAAGVRYVVFWLNDVDTDDALDIHLSIGNNSNFWQYNVGFAPPEHGWAVFVVDLADSTNFTRIIGLPSVSYTLALRTADRLHWRHDLPPFVQAPDAIIGQLGLDGISFTNAAGGVVELPAPPASQVLVRPAVPNPTFGPTQLAIELAQPARSRVFVVSPAGRLVREIFQGELGAGSHVMSWDGRGFDGAAVGSGVYFFRIETGQVSRSMPVTILH